MNDYELGWVIGLFEGEGTMRKKYGRKRKDGSKPNYGIAFHIQMHSREIELLNKFKDLVKCGTVYGPYKRKVGNDFCEWIVQKKEDSEYFMKLIYPYLSNRRQEQISKCIEK